MCSGTARSEVRRCEKRNIPDVANETTATRLTRGEYESFEKAAARLQELTQLCQRRKQHTIWLATQRIAVSPIIPMHPSRVTPHTSRTRTVPTGPNSKEGTGANDSGDGVFGLWHDL